MKQIIFSISLVLLMSSSFAQLTAVTGNGDEVILNIDGTWKYANDSVQNINKIDTNKIDFHKNSSASFLVKSNRITYGVYIDPKKWSFTKSSVSEASEFVFTLKEKDAYGMLISEKIEMPIETLKEAAMANAKEAAPDIKIIKEEYRKVNNNIVLLMQMDGTIKGIKFIYLGYYYSSPKGTVQLLTYTSTNLLNEYKKDLEEFLNGFIVFE